MAGGRKPAQPSIPEGILGFPPPDANTHRTLETKLNSLKTNDFKFLSPSKKFTALRKKLRVMQSYCPHFLDFQPFLDPDAPELLR